MLELTDTQWAALLDGACPPFQGLNSWSATARRRVRSTRTPSARSAGRNGWRSQRRRNEWQRCMRTGGT